MKLNIYQVDAFAEKVFEGNPAAVCPLEEWVSDDVLQKIAEENICNACTADKIKFDYVLFLELESRMSCKQ